MARKHARGEEMPAEPKRRRLRCDAASHGTFDEVLQVAGMAQRRRRPRRDGSKQSVARVDLAMVTADAVGPATMAVIVDLVTMVASRGLPHGSKPLFTRVGLATMVVSRHQPDGSKQLLTRNGLATMVVALWLRDLSVVPAVVFEFVGVGVGAVVVLAADAEAVAEIEVLGA
uniref:Uncharacterized protein n=1 Tax=Phytophthora ramorum TaxID=164328 RepID=H3H0Y5_PHYRM